MAWLYLVYMHRSQHGWQEAAFLTIAQWEWQIGPLHGPWWQIFSPTILDWAYLNCSALWGLSLGWRGFRESSIGGYGWGALEQAETCKAYWGLGLELAFCHFCPLFLTKASHKKLGQGVSLYYAINAINGPKN